MRRLYPVLFSLLALFCSLVPAALALEIIYPGDKTIIERSDFIVIKGGLQPPLDGMIVEVNGVSSDVIDIGAPEYQAAFADFLILEPEWEKGKNTLVVKGMSKGKEVAKSKAEFYYRSAADPAAITPKGFTPFRMHTPAKEALCAPCHNMDPTAAQLKGATPENNPCASCHRRMLDAKYVHGPEGVFQCSDCHDGTSQPVRWQITKPILTLCGECHTDKLDAFRKSPFVHGPVAVGDCTVCHDPHAANEPAQVVAPVNSLCLGCHVNVNKTGHVMRGIGGKGHPLDTRPDPSQPGRKMSCASCHDPHSGGSQAFFRKQLKNRYDLCQECHKK